MPSLHRAVKAPLVLGETYVCMEMSENCSWNDCNQRDLGYLRHLSAIALGDGVRQAKQNKTKQKGLGEKKEKDLTTVKSFLQTLEGKSSPKVLL